MIGDTPACSKCQIRPRRPYPQKPGTRRRWYSYCQTCHTEYQRDRKAGKIQVLVTADEWAEIKAARAARAKSARRHRGRHAAA